MIRFPPRRMPPTPRRGYYTQNASSLGESLVKRNLLEYMCHCPSNCLQGSPYSSGPSAGLELVERNKNDPRNRHAKPSDKFDIVDARCAIEAFLMAEVNGSKWLDLPGYIPISHNIETSTLWWLRSNGPVPCSNFNFNRDTHVESSRGTIAALVSTSVSA